MRYICLLAFSIVCSLAHATLRMDFQVKEEIETKPDPTVKADTVVQTRDYLLVVYLGEGFIEYQEGADRHRILDFEGERLYYRDSASDGYWSTSIYSDLGFRLYEFRNRLFLGELARNVQKKGENFSPVFPEHLFSLRSENSEEIEQRNRRNGVSFAHGRDLLLRHSSNLSSVAPRDRERFVVFLRNAYGIHPDILDALSGLEGVPEQLEIVQWDFGKRRRVLQLKSVKEIEYRPPLPETDTSRPEAEGALWAISRRALERDQEERELAIDALALEAVTLAEAGRTLDAMLLFLEYTLCTGEDLPAEFFGVREAITSDANVERLFGLLESTGEDPQTTLDGLRKLDESVDEGQRALRIFMANTLAALGEGEKAKELFLEALEENPLIAGAWKDLGDVYYGAYDSRSAWLCWDTGRRLLPSRKLFQPVYAFEETLRKDHPEFFLDAIGE